MDASILIAITACIASFLTFFSGFGLATLLTPVMLAFFPVEVAIALTGIVHLLNNFFKIGLVWKHINWKIAIRFGIFAAAGAFIGALVLAYISARNIGYSYMIGDRIISTSLVKLVIAVLLIVFVLIEFFPRLKMLKLNKDLIYGGGFASGFFGGLSGHQGALRSAFLISFGLTKEQFIATGIVIACFIDITRLSVYFSSLSTDYIYGNSTVLIIAVLAAFLGAFAGNKMMKKMTYSFIQKFVLIAILLFSIALGMGVV